MRVLWTHNFDPDKSGKGSFVHTTARGIRERGVEVTLEYLGNLRSVRQIVRSRARVRRLARNFDLVHAQFGSACALVTAAADGVPKLLTIRGSDWNRHDTPGFLYFHTRLAGAMSRIALRSYDCVLSVSHRSAVQLARAAPNVRVEVLPSPVDLTRFVPRDKALARAQLGYPNCREKWILFNALDLANPIKRFGLARQAFALAQARMGNLRLRLATDMSHDEMPLFVAACDLILCTSSYEGWPNSVKEALACNVPFVATDVSDLAEIANREPSCRVCPADVEAIADNICDVLARPQPSDLVRYISDMSLDASSERLIAIYQAMLAPVGYSRKSVVVEQ